MYASNHPYAVAAVQAACDNLTPEGLHNRLVMAAFWIGGYIGGGHLDANEAEAKLLSAAVALAPDRAVEFKRTIAEGIKEGRQCPLSPPEKRPEWMSEVPPVTPTRPTINVHHRLGADILADIWSAVLASPYAARLRSGPDLPGRWESPHRTLYLNGKIMTTEDVNKMLHDVAVYVKVRPDGEWRPVKAPESMAALLLARPHPTIPSLPEPEPRPEWLSEVPPTRHDPVSAACDVLIDVRPSYADPDPRERIARIALLKKAAGLLSIYGWEVTEHASGPDTYWRVERGAGNKGLVFGVARDGAGFTAHQATFGVRDLGQEMQFIRTFQPQISFDVRTGALVGPYLFHGGSQGQWAVRDMTAPGYPRIRLGAMEALVHAMARLLRG